MQKIEPVKRIVENVTGISVPSREQAAACVRAVKPRRMKFRADGYIPNNEASASALPPRGAV
jgi:hypothetical protein